MSSTDAYERGLKVRREVLGDDHVDRSTAHATEHTRDFQEFITRYAWGDVWSRPGLDRRTRSVIAMTALVAVGHFDELALHIRGARSNGLSPEEISEVLLQTAIYCGVPAANSAFQVFQRALEEDAA
jgi:3-oxoadipate enol-lactonase/4-carboxymuconolactone decarboxylase